MSIQELLDRLRADDLVWMERSSRPGQPPKRISYTSSFLNNVADVFEARGLDQARLYASSKLNSKDDGAARGVLRVLDYIADCPAARDDPPVGRTVIKALTDVCRAVKR